MIELGEASPADVRTAVEAHQRSLAWSGDSFMADRWLEGEHCAVVVDCQAVGVTGWTDDGLSLLTSTQAARRHDRQVAQVVLRESGARTAYVASWDAHRWRSVAASGTAEDLSWAGAGSGDVRAGSGRLTGCRASKAIHPLPRRHFALEAERSPAGRGSLAVSGR